ncbi:MAG: arylamine N-acetyltransferase [Gammaproteobacteria bacterium]|nr:arylamine N-acetyltransferase [Gammaproteobacteria bacterium]
MNTAQVATYLDRIGGVQITPPSEILLRELVWKHATTIPFDALAIHCGDPVDVSHIDAIFKKLVLQKRGGWCYEMNGLFYYILQALGFEVAVHLASVFEKEWLPPTHAMLTVNLDGKTFLTDVGFGNWGLTEPIDLNSSDEIRVMKNGLHYQLTHSDSGEYLYSAGFNDRISPQYRFRLSEKPLSLKDFIPLNIFFSTQKESPFVEKAVIKLATPHGFRKLINKELTEYETIGTRMDTIKSPAVLSKVEYLELLKQKFGVNLAPDVTFVSPLKGADPALSF